MFIYQLRRERQSLISVTWLVTYFIASKNKDFTNISFQTQPRLRESTMKAGFKIAPTPCNMRGVGHRGQIEKFKPFLSCSMLQWIYIFPFHLLPMTVAYVVRQIEKNNLKSTRHINFFYQYFVSFSYETLLYLPPK